MGDYLDVYYQVSSKEETELLRKEITFHPDHLARQVLWITLSSILFWIIVFNGKHWIETRCVVWNIFYVQNISSSEKAIFPSAGKSIFLLSENHISCSLAAMQLMNLKMWSPQPPIKIYIWCTIHICWSVCGIPLYRRQVFILDINNIISNIIISIIIFIMRPWMAEDPSLSIRFKPLRPLATPSLERSI